MNKNDLIKKVAKEADASIAETKKIVDTLFTSLCEELKSGETVSISGFGRFTAIKKKGTTRICNLNGKEIHTEDKTYCKFEAGRALLDYLSEDNK